MNLKLTIKKTSHSNFRFTISGDNEDNWITEASVDFDIKFKVWFEKNVKKTTKPVGYFHSFGTKPEFKHFGFGRKMLECVKEESVGKILILQVRSTGPMTNEELVEFYKSEGFKMIEDKPGQYSCYYRMMIEL